jgi:hypothetical protein
MPAVNPSYVSIDMNLSYNSGTFASPVFAVVNCRDVKLALTWGEGEVSNRGSKFDLKEPTLRVQELVFDMVADELDTNFVAIRAAALARTPIELAMANTPIGTAGTVASGGTVNGVMSRCTYKAFGIERGEPLEGSPTVSITVKPCKLAQTNVPTDNVLLA